MGIAPFSAQSSKKTKYNPNCTQAGPSTKLTSPPAKLTALPTSSARRSIHPRYSIDINQEGERKVYDSLITLIKQINEEKPFKEQTGHAFKMEEDMMQL